MVTIMVIMHRRKMEMRWRHDNDDESEFKVQHSGAGTDDVGITSGITLHGDDWRAICIRLCRLCRDIQKFRLV